MYANRSIRDIVDVSQRWTARVDSLGSLLSHSFANLLFEVVVIVLHHDEGKLVHEFCFRLRIAGDDLPVFCEMNGDTEIVQLHVIVKIPVQAVCFF